MSDPTTRAQAGSTEEISDAVLEYLTSIKQVVKRNGAVQDFDVQKLRLSIAKALGASGMKPDLADKITGYVMTRLTKPGVHPYDLIEWEKRDARITNEKGQVVFEQKGVEVPKWWTQTATNVVVSKYFRGKIGEADR